MPMGDYDEDEHERREQKATAVDTSFASDREDYHGEVEYDTGSSTEDLLNTFEEIKSQ
ncbi:hypothetical protein K0C01_07260 [Salinarchaeum sp. IM2453]|uniref:DUF5786 family protein n=1 Tax=Salinarchaeum sp. IM2453 TaxID=2862870 RepID=UPI001C832CB3|nr:DUF5786 family protein [Salinarchaeum sp. IM2453]QZA87609.1 hypothetical protein K0C01_07260 [Salinarchaeum sp. IM2453]